MEDVMGCVSFDDFKDAIRHVWNELTINLK